MKIKNRRKDIFIKNGIAFLLTYIFMMGILTYITSSHNEQKMYFKSENLSSELYKIMDTITPKEDDEIKTISASTAYIDSQMNQISLSAASENIYLTATLYHNNKIIAKTGNVRIIGKKIDTWRYNRCSKLTEQGGFAEDFNKFVGGKTNRITFDWSILDVHMDYGIIYYPFETAVLQLLPVYILSFIFLTILMFQLSFKLSNILTKRAELLKIRNDYTNAVAHELKTPLAIMRCFCEGLKEKINEDKQEHYQNVISDEIDHMDTMVFEMLKLTTLESNQVTLNPVGISVNLLVKQVLSRYHVMILNNQLKVSVSCSDEYIINGDKVMLEQVISNFLSNAIRHTPAGGYIKIAAEQIDKSGEHTLIFTIENSGMPIPQDKMRYIWDAYYKADEARSRADGTGLGLSIVKSILLLHGFNYGVQNTENGVKFWFEVKTGKVARAK